MTRWRQHDCISRLNNPETSRFAWIELQAGRERVKFESEAINKLIPPKNIYRNLDKIAYKRQLPKE